MENASYNSLDNVTHLALITSWEEFQCGEAVDFDSLNLVGGGVHLGDDDTLIALVLVSQLIPDGCQLFAVAAPGGICMEQGRWNKSDQIVKSFQTFTVTKVQKGQHKKFPF